MAFFKPSDSSGPSRLISRLDALIWVLIFGGLLTLVLGLSMIRIDIGWSWGLMTVGGTVALIGFVLIYVRSRIESPP